LSNSVEGKPKMRGITNIRGHSFFAQRLKPNCVIVDLGANKGEFSRRAKLQYDAQCISVEANPELADELQRDNARLNVMNCAVSNSHQPITFYVSADSESSSIVPNVSGEQASERTVEAKTLDDVIEENHLDRINLLKVDIEGAELPMIGSLSDNTLEKIDQITIEFHDFTGAISKKDVTDIVKRLESAGFRSIKFSVSNKDWLFYRPDRLEIGLPQHLVTKFILRNIYAVTRKLGLSHHE
jgi:FkbM family methyltransferase